MRNHLRNFKLITLSLLSSFLVIITVKYHFYRPISSPIAQTGPNVSVVGYLHKKDKGIFALSLSTNQWHCGIGASELPYLYAVNTSPGALRGGMLCTPMPTNSQAMPVRLQRWKLLSHTRWRKEATLPIRTQECYGLTCSPNGVLAAFWTSSGKNAAIYIANWDTKAVQRVASLPDAHGLRLACTNKAAVYACSSDSEGKSTATLKLTEDSILPLPCAFDQVITNQVGDFGIVRQFHAGKVEVRITDLSNMSEMGEFVNENADYLEPSSTFPFLSYITLGDLVCSDDGEWWATTVHERNHSFPSKLILWKKGGKRSYYQQEENSLKTFVPMGITKVEF